MSALPKLRVRVRPDERALFLKWQWIVDEEHAYSDGKATWSAVFTGWGHLTGNCRTEEKALRKGRAAAADHCEKLLIMRQRDTYVERNTTIEPVTCEDEPV